MFLNNRLENDNANNNGAEPFHIERPYAPEKARCSVRVILLELIEQCVSAPDPASKYADQNAQKWLAVAGRYRDDPAKQSVEIQYDDSR